MEKLTKIKNKVVQSAYISIETQEIIKKEARKRGIRFPSHLVGIVLSDWANKITLENARDIIRDANGKKE